MTHLTASCLKPGDIVHHKRYNVDAAVERVVERGDGLFWVVLKEVKVPNERGIIGGASSGFYADPADLVVVVARRVV